MKCFTKTYYTLFISLLTLLFTMLILSSFYDLDISLAIADQNSVFGMINASFGEAIGWGMMGVFGAMAFRISSKVKKPVLKALLIIFGLALLATSIYLTFIDLNEAKNGFKAYSNVYVNVLISFIIEVAISFIAYLVIDIDDLKTLLVFWVILMLAYFVGLAVNFITKALVFRPRYSFINNYYGSMFSIFDLFEPWYLAASKGAAESAFPVDIVYSDSFKSLPSQHSFVSMSSILLSFIPLLNKKVRNKNWVRYVVFTVAMLYGLSVQFGRIRFGSNYLSDTALGGLIAVISSFAIPLIGFKVANKRGWLKETKLDQA